MLVDRVQYHPPPQRLLEIGPSARSDSTPVGNTFLPIPKVDNTEVAPVC